MRRVLLIAGLLGAGIASHATELGVRGTQFTLNGKPTFLLGISYYGGLGASDATVEADLRDAKRYGFNWIRVWATWSAFGEDVSAVDAAGEPREPYFGRLQRLIARCDRMGIVVDVTLSKGKGLPDVNSQRTAVETLIGGLKRYHNWYLDLSNERNIGDARYSSFADLAELRALVLKLDPHLLVSASHGGDMSRDEVAGYLRTGVDFLAPHRPREAGTAVQTESKTREYLAWARELGRELPVHYQEPFRRGYADWQPAVDDYLTDLHGAVAGGAAGWCFHNGDSRRAPESRPRRSFDLREKRLFEQLDGVESAALTTFADVVNPPRRRSGRR